MTDPDNHTVRVRPDRTGPAQDLASRAHPTLGRLHAATVQRHDHEGGKTVKVVFDVADDAYVDTERHMAAAIARD
jgi:hypothetical protein